MYNLSGLSSEIVQNTMVKVYFHSDQCIQLMIISIIQYFYLFSLCIVNK
jgi:hypothetical protein